MGGRHARTCLEYTFARDAFALSAEADTGKCGTIDKLQDSIWSIFCLTGENLGGSNGWSRNAIGSITL
jgi:hypothetical protein